MSEPCLWFWGSHGCELEQGHLGYHECSSPEYDEDGNIIGVDLCSQQDDENNRVRFMEWSDDGTGIWSDWIDGWEGFR